MSGYDENSQKTTFEELLQSVQRKKKKSGQKEKPNQHYFRVLWACLGYENIRKYGSYLNIISSYLKYQPPIYMTLYTWSKSDNFDWKAWQMEQGFVDVSDDPFIQVLINKINSELNNNDKWGYVYFLHNPAHKKDCIKIGCTTKNICERSEEIYKDSTGIPSKFDTWGFILSHNCERLENELHSFFKEYRHNKDREFFNINWDVLCSMYDAEFPSLPKYPLIKFITGKGVKLNEDVYMEMFNSESEDSSDDNIDIHAATLDDWYSEHEDEEQGDDDE